MSSGDDFNTIRIAVGRTIVERLRAKLGVSLIAAAVYGSVAHEDAGAESDVELAIVTDETVRYADVFCFE